MNTKKIKRLLIDDKTRKSVPVKKIKILIFLFIVTLIFSFLSRNISLGADPDFPRWQVGNWWKFNIEIYVTRRLCGN